MRPRNGERASAAARGQRSLFIWASEKCYQSDLVLRRTSPVLALLLACAPAPRHAPAGLGSSGSAAITTVATLGDAGSDASTSEGSLASTAPLSRANSGAECPLSFADADVELGRVAGAPITACDVALFALSSLREGGAPLSAREALARAVIDATFAREWQARTALNDQELRARIERTLADAAVRDAARRRFVGPDRAELQRYFDAHRADFDRDARVHVRAIALDSEARARAVIDELRGGAAFERLAEERSTLPSARRDQGDLGLCTREGSDYVPRPLAERAFALSEFAAVDPEPVRVEVTELVGRRRRPRTRVRWFVLQRLERIEAEPATLESAARRIAFRLSSSGWREALLRERGALIERARAIDAVTIDERALRTVRIRDERPPRPRSASRAPRRRR